MKKLIITILFLFISSVIIYSRPSVPYITIYLYKDNNHNNFYNIEYNEFRTLNYRRFLRKYKKQYIDYINKESISKNVMIYELNVIKQYINSENKIKLFSFWAYEYFNVDYNQENYLEELKIIVMTAINRIIITNENETKIVYFNDSKNFDIFIVNLDEIFPLNYYIKIN